MGTNYYDPVLFSLAENSLKISADASEGGSTNNYINLPTTTYTQYKAAVGSAYNYLTPLQQILVNYHMSALTEVVSSGITTDPDYWSASSVNGSFIVNSGLTTSKIGIGTTIPNHTLTVSGTVSASSSLYAGVTDVTNLKIAGTQGSDGQVLTSTGSGVAWEDSTGGGTNVYWSASSLNANAIVNSGMTSSKVGVGTLIPNHKLSVSGSVSASSVVYGTTLEGTIDGGSF